MTFRSLLLAGVVMGIMLVHPHDGVAQALPLRFDKLLFECENQYVLLPASGNDSAYQCQYVYIDRTAGFTMQYMATVGVKPIGVVFRAKDVFDSTKLQVKTRIRDSDRRRVAVLSAAMVEQLNLPAQPEWAAFYRDKDPIADAAARAFQYNHVGLSSKAAEILGPVFTSAVTDKDFLFEYAFALNATQRFDTACAVCVHALAMHEKEIRLLKEYGFCLMQLNKLDDAVKVLEKTYGLCDKTDREREIAAECCVNIAAVKRHQGDEESAKAWIEKGKAVVPVSSYLYKRIKGM